MASLKGTCDLCNNPGGSNCRHATRAVGITCNGAELTISYQDDGREKYKTWRDWKERADNKQ